MACTSSASQRCRSTWRCHEGSSRRCSPAPPRPTRNRYDAEGAALTTRTRSLLARRRLNGVHVDGVIQIGTSFTLPPGISFVTLEDMTLRQASASHPVFSRMSAHGIARWEKRRVEIYARARMCAVASHWAGAVAAQRLRPPARARGGGRIRRHPHRDRARSRVDPSAFPVRGDRLGAQGGAAGPQRLLRVRLRPPRRGLDVVGGHPSLRAPGVERPRRALAGARS